jgi:hypothetical protein
MAQLIDAECWPEPERPRAIAYSCGALDEPSVPPSGGQAYSGAQQARVRANAIELLERHLPHLLPGVARGGRFRWELLCGRNGHRGRDAIDTQFWLANVDASDRYVQCSPGSDRYRLRPDESGFENLVLAGDWTDNGINAGCIEAATISGLQAANAALGRSRRYRISGSLIS